MTVFKKRLFIILLAFACVFATLAFGAQNSVHATDTKTLDDVTFVMIDGASVRLKDGSYGMRFAGAITYADYDGLVENYGEENIDCGMFIMPVSYIDKVGELNYDNTFGESAKFIWGDKATSVKVDGKYRIIHMETLAVATGYDPYIGAQVYKIQGSVHGVLDQNLARDYTACAYIKAGGEYKFATGTPSRSMVEVALRAINSGDYDDTENPAIVADRAVLDGYVSAFKTYIDDDNPTFSYTINYVDEGGTIVDSDVLGINLNTAIDRTLTAPSGYALDESCRLQEHVYASDKTINVKVKSATVLTDASTLHNSFAPGDNSNSYAVEDDIIITDPSITGSSTIYYHNYGSHFTGVLDGKGHIIKDAIIDDDITSYGFLSAAATGSTIRDIAIVNFTGSYRNFITYTATDFTIENAYLSGSCKYHDYFEEVRGGVEFNYVILNAYCTDGKALGKAGYSAADAERVSYNNVIKLDGDAYTVYENNVEAASGDDFFADYASGLGAEWAARGFTVENDTLYFHGTEILKKN